MCIRDRRECGNNNNHPCDQPGNLIWDDDPPNHPNQAALMPFRAQLIALQTILIKETLRFLRIWICLLYTSRCV